MKHRIIVTCDSEEQRRNVQQLLSMALGYSYVSTYDETKDKVTFRDISNCFNTIEFNLEKLRELLSIEKEKEDTDDIRFEY